MSSPPTAYEEAFPPSLRRSDAGGWSETSPWQSAAVKQANAAPPADPVPQGGFYFSAHLRCVSPTPSWLFL